MMERTELSVFDVSQEPAKLLADHIARVFAAVWRFDFSTPGFCVLDLGSVVNSHELRALMLGLKERLSEVNEVRFVYRSMGRFDQQETTKFHLDGAPDQSLLLLGYEPSKVQSRLSFADYSRCAYERGMEPKPFLDEFNPMYRMGEELLSGYVTEPPQPAEGHSRIVLINNSSLPFTEGRRNSLGVLHKAEILNPDESKCRIVNSIMLSVGGTEEVGTEQLRAFVATDEISKKIYV